MSFLTPPLKQKPGATSSREKLSLTLSQGKKKRISKQFNLKDGEYGSDTEKNTKKSMSMLDMAQEDSSGSSDSECELSFTTTEKNSSKEEIVTQISNDFALDFQVSSVAVDRAGRFVVAGFNNGTIRLYPLRNSTTANPVVVGSLESEETTTIDENKLVFRKGVVLEHISARGMYTQLRVNVVIPDDGRFIFAGVYRGSTEILVIDIDSILLPTDVIGVPTAEVTTHSYNDAKLRGFGAVRAVPGNSDITSEYQVLCGLGIKNLHLWRFYWDPTNDDPESKWTWQCIFDRQTNGISIEYLAFGSEPNQLISKSEHQPLRVWTIDETNDAMNFDYEDVKHTQDMVQVCGDFAYGGQQHLAVVNLKSGQRIELNLPSTTAPTARPTLNNRKRQLRTVSFLSGVQDVKLGVCSDGSVFVHDTAPENGLGVHNPPTSVSGYEAFYQDQAGLLSILPYDGSNDTDEWLVVMANSTQLQVKPLHEFLHLPSLPKKTKTIKVEKPVKKKAVKKVSKTFESPPLKRNLELSLETTKTKKTSKEKKSWSYDTAKPAEDIDLSKLKKRKAPSADASKPKLSADCEKENVEPTINLPKEVSPPPVVVVHTPQPRTPERVEEEFLYHTPQPKKLKTREKEEVISPVVSISPASSPCLLQTPNKASTPVKEWSPFVIPKKKKNIPHEIQSQPTAEPELEIQAEIPQPEPTNLEIMLPNPVEVPCEVTPETPEVSRQIFEQAQQEIEAAEANKHDDMALERGACLLMQVSAMHHEKMQSPVTEESTKLLNQFKCDRENLLALFATSHKKLIFSACTDLYKNNTNRMDINVIRKRFQARVDELLGQQRLQCDALHAYQLMQWTVNGYGPFEMTKFAPTFSAPGLFG